MTKIPFISRKINSANIFSKLFNQENTIEFFPFFRGAFPARQVNISSECGTICSFAGATRPARPERRRCGNRFKEENVPSSGRRNTGWGDKCFVCATRAKVRHGGQPSPQNPSFIRPPKFQSLCVLHPYFARMGIPCCLYSGVAPSTDSASK